MSKPATPTPARQHDQRPEQRPELRDEKSPRFSDLRETRRVPLDHRRSEEEARLAAEIEKLRG